MTAHNAGEPRDVLPRWRSWGAAQRSHELDPLRPRDWEGEKAALAEEFLEHKVAFEKDPGIYTAADLLASSAVLRIKDESVSVAAENIMRNRDAPATVRQLAAEIMGPKMGGPLEEDLTPRLDEERLRLRVRRLRRILSREPDNVIRWADLSRAHAALGNRESAGRTMTVALSGGINRFLLRAGTRLYVYRDDPDKALALLRQHTAHLKDPWVLAAEIATASWAGRSSRNIRQARKIIEDGGFPPWHISELASALATVELRSGHARQARRLMRRALEEPTENTIAQAESYTDLVGEVDPVLLNVPFGFEARARHLVRSGEYNAALSSCLQWLADQPFAYEPASYTSYLASVLVEDYQRAALAAQVGVKSHPDSDLLWNNLAFAYANLGKLNEAREIVKSRLKSVESRLDLAVFTATDGFIQFRSGHPEDARLSYRVAVEALTAQRNYEAATIAASYWARGEAVIGSNLCEDVLREAEILVQKAASDDARHCLDRAHKFVREARSRREP